MMKFLWTDTDVEWEGQMVDQPKLPSGWVNKTWDGSAAQFKDASAYCAACLIDLNPGKQTKTKGLCMLPYKESSGEINVHGVIAAIGGRGIMRISKPDGVPASAFAAAKRAAAKKLVWLYGQMGRTPLDAVVRMASR